MAVDTSKLVQSTMVLREAAPREWESWLGSLREYSAIMNQELVRAEPSHLARSQGMAMALQDLVVTLVKAPEAYDKARAMREGRPRDGRTNEWTG